MENHIIPLHHNSIRHDISVGYRQASADLIVFLHGLGCSRDSFNKILQQEDFGDFSLLALDLPGFGDSARPLEFSYTLEDHAEICATIIEAIAFERLYIAAHSMGGAIGLLLPDRVIKKTEAFANIEGNLVSTDCGKLSRHSASMSYEDFRESKFREFTSPVANSEYRYFSPAKTSPEAFYRSAASLVSWSDSGRLPEKFKAAEFRKAYFYGDRSRDLPFPALPGDALRIEIPGSGHFPMDESPDRFYAELFKFFTQTQ